MSIQPLLIKSSVEVYRIGIATNYDQVLFSLDVMSESAISLIVVTWNKLTGSISQFKRLA